MMLFWKNLGEGGGGGRGEGGGGGRRRRRRNLILAKKFSVIATNIKCNSDILSGIEDRMFVD